MYRIRLLYAIISFLLAINGIPFQLPRDLLPAGFVYKNGLLIYTRPMGYGFNSDKLCSLLFHPWWVVYQEARLKAMQSKKLQIYDPLLAKDFTRYPDPNDPTIRPDVPVEAFAGVNQGPIEGTWNPEHEACFTGCQDIRTTIEWIMAMGIETKQHVRAKLRLAFLCEKGLVALLEYNQPSLRERESQQEEDEAIASLEYRMPTKRDYTSVHGEKENLIKCRCTSRTDPAFLAAQATPRPFNPTEKKRGAYEAGHRRRKRTDLEREQIAAAKAKLGINRGRGDRRKRKQYVYRNGRQQGLDAADYSVGECYVPDLSGIPVDEDNYEIGDQGLSTEEELGIDDFEIDDLDYNHEEEGGAGTSMCYDYEYPELPEPTTPIGTIQRVEPNTEETTTFGTLLQAALRICADFDINAPLSPKGKPD